MGLNFTLDVTPRTKKNSQQMITLPTGKHILVASKAYRQFETECIKDIKKKGVKVSSPIDCPVNLKCIFYKDKDYKSDLVGYLQAIQDTLVKAKILLDDNHKIVQSTNGSKVFLDREHPRIEIEIEKIL